MPGEIKQVDGAAAKCCRGLFKARKRARQREDGPVVIGIRVPVEQSGGGRRRRGPGQFAETGLVAALADVDHALGQR